MATTVNVLCPNGRRFNIKVSPNDTVMQVLEKVCVKAGKFSVNEYDLRHQKKILDVTVPFRYAKVPNLGKLEMVKLHRPRSQSTVHIALQVQSGERFAHDFKSDVSLFEILLHWDSVKNDGYGLSEVKTEDNQTLQPVCIYMRREIIGQPWLRHISLQSLGVTSGKAVIRHMHRATDLPPAPPIIPQAVNTKLPHTEERPAVDSPASSRDDTQERRTASENPQPPSKSNEDVTETVMEAQSATNSDQGTPPEEMDTAETTCGTNHKPEPPQEETMETEEGQITSEEIGASQSSRKDVTKQPQASDETKTTVGNQSSTAGRSEVSMETQSDTETLSVESFLQSHGASSVSLDERTRERIKLLKKKEAEMMREMNEVAQQLRAQQMAASANVPTFPTSPLQDFKFPDTTQTRVTAEEEKPRQLAESAELSKPCDRRVLVFHASDTLPSSDDFHDLPDNFFNVTADDMRKLLSDLKSQQSSERPLETKNMREARKQKQMKKYSKVSVRIHFPDHHIVQVFFRPKEKVEALYRFVKESLCDEGAFYLYTTPPKTTVKNNTQTFFEANLFPTAKVYFGSESSKGQYLSQAILEKKVTLAQAEATAFNESPSSTSASSIDGTSSSSCSSQPGPSSEPAGPSQSKRTPPVSQPRNAPSSSNSKGHVPKWFKIGKS